MPITQVTTVTIDGLEIGLSDTIGNLITNGDFTPENLTPYMFCGQLNQITPKFNSLSGSEKIYTGNASGMPLYFPNVNTGSYIIPNDTVEFAINDNPTYVNDLYGRNVLLYDTGRVESIHSDSTSMAARVVTSIDFKKIYYDVELANTPISLSRPASEIDCYVSGSLGCVRTTTNNVDTLIKVYSIVTTENDWYCILDNLFPASDTAAYSHLISSWQTMQGNYGNTTSNLIYCLDNFDKTKSMFKYTPSTVYEIYGGENQNWGQSFTAAIELSNDAYTYLDYYAGNYSGSMHCYIKTLTGALRQIANVGLAFKYNNTMYKPTGDGGFITGYTDDMTQTSDWDDINNVTGNTVPITPPSPTPPAGDNENVETEMPLAYIGGTGGFVQFIKINSAGLASADDISEALSRFDITTIGKDLLRNFVSFKCFAVLSIDPDDTVTRQITVDGHGLTDANDNPLQGQVIGGVLPIDFTIGTAPRYFNDFRDYAPYTKLEAYVPFCGWFPLPSWCIGLNIHGTMFTDLYNGTVKAVIYASDTVVSEVGGCCAYDIPFVADATGAKAGAVISSALSTAAATAATVALPNVATGITAVSSAANTISAANSNSTTLKGVLGDGSNLNGLLHCYLKITRPQSPTRNKAIPNSYKHEFGIPCYKELVLASGDGFTQVNDANVSGNMTATEKQMIIDGFRHGLIL